MNISEDTFAFWSQGPSTTESAKCDNAESVVCNAIEADDKLSGLDISVFVQGSYRARTNIRQESDVDVCIRYNGSFFPEYPEGTTKETFGNVDGTLPYADFKNMVENALKSRFGEAGVTREKKAFDVHANTYRIDADVIPTFEHRRYTGRKDTMGDWEYYSGVAFIPDGGNLIKNWPEQNYSNGVSRNNETGRSYKRAIRVLKHLQNKMNDEGVREACYLGGKHCSQSRGYSGNRHERKPTWSEENPQGRWRPYDYEDLLKRDKLNLDIFWLKDESLEDSANLPDPDVIAAEIVEDLEAALQQFGAIANDLKK
jgi:hypothetical protein